MIKIKLYKLILDIANILLYDKLILLIKVNYEKQVKKVKKDTKSKVYYTQKI